MKLRIIALASASLIAFATPAAAGGDGWYLGLGAGLSKMDELKYQRAVPGGKFKFDNTARFDAAAGYKWASGLRLELEDGYASYKVSSATTPAGVAIAGATGHVAVGTLMPVVAYDIPLTPEFAFTIGAGAGAGRVLAAYSDPTEANRKGDTALPIS
jgi:opacity protein-like surface antigen